MKILHDAFLSFRIFCILCIKIVFLEYLNNDMYIDKKENIREINWLYYF